MHFARQKNGNSAKDRHEAGSLPVGHGEKTQILFFADTRFLSGNDLVKAPHGTLLLERFGTLEADGFSIMPLPKQHAPQLGLLALDEKLDTGKRLAQPMGNEGTGQGIDHTGPHQIAGNRIPQNRQGQAGRQLPEDGAERDQRQDGAEQAEAGIQHAATEQCGIFGQALIGVVMTGQGFQAVVPPLLQPFAQQFFS